MKHFKSLQIVQTIDRDWDGVYLDGKLVYENHRLDPLSLLKILEIKYELKSIDTDSETISNGRFPKNIEDFKEELK